ncbi:MAG: PHP domain-containing protein [Treponemataceae bacterium]
MKEYLSVINDANATGAERLSALRSYEKARFDSGTAAKPATGEINNHVHTIYSFSPYTPSMAALRARDAGLEAAGSVDHDSIGAAEEMIDACAILGIGGCVGFELRVSFKRGTDGKPGRFADRKINNPDSPGLVYMTVQGVPRGAIPAVREFLAPIQKSRGERNRRMVESINTILRSGGLTVIDYTKDVLSISKAAEGGGVTERHILSAVATVLIDRYGKTAALVAALDTKLDVRPSPKISVLLSDANNPHYLFDLLGVLKSTFLERVFIQPNDDECVPAKTVVDFARSIGAIPAYAYLGDVGESPTGDKKAEKFEDAYLDELFDELSRIGYKAVAYMPPRNTVEQLKRVQRLCAEHGFMEISGVDINSSRQSFNCPEVLKPEFKHLVDTTWALIAHERLASIEKSLDIFAADNPLTAASLATRISVYTKAGRALDKHRPEESAAAVAQNLRTGRYSS